MDYVPPTFKVVAGVGSFLQVDAKKSRLLILSGPLPGPAEEVTASPDAHATVEAVPRPRTWSAVRRGERMPSGRRWSDGRWRGWARTLRAGKPAVLRVWTRETWGRQGRLRDSQEPGARMLFISSNFGMAERVGFVPSEPAPVNNLGQFSIAQIARNAQTLSIRYNTGTVKSVVESRPRRRRDRWISSTRVASASSGFKR